MGFYPGMVTAPKTGCESYVVQISNLGECVVYRLNEKGEPDGFVTSKSPVDMLSVLAAHISPNAEVKMWFEDQHLVRYLTCWQCSTWAEVVAELNRRPRRSAGRIVSCYYDCHSDVFRKYIGRVEDGRRFAVSQAGLDYDAKFHPKKAEPNSPGDDTATA